MLIPFTVFAEGQGPAGALPEYSLDVSFDVPNSRITGVAKTGIQAGKEIAFATGDLRILEIKMNGSRINSNVINGTLKVLPSQNGSIEIRYEGIFKDKNNAPDTNYGVVGNVIDERGISLTGDWYPQVDSLCRYRLRATLPAGYNAVSEAEQIRKTPGKGGTEYVFDFPHPAAGITFIATDKYEETKGVFNTVDIYAYFFAEDRELAKKYIEYAKKYLKLYEELLGAYPYKRFSIVENFLPSGYSMPAYTLLGQGVMRLPFIVETSFGHEILHQWFGNSVYVDYDRGNWAEGITTYLADHLYEEQKGKGREYRKQILVDYESYVNPKNEIPLKNFKGRVDSASKAVGYGKAAMVFHMLRNTVGDGEFYASLKELIDQRQFRKASWDDIRQAFEKVSKKDLGWFFKQWVDEAGMPGISFDSLEVIQDGSRFNVNFDLLRSGKAFTLDLPVTVRSQGGRAKKTLSRVDKEKNSVSLSAEEKPEEIVLDEDYDTARTLADKELPPVLSMLFGEEKNLIALPPAPAYGREIYKSFIDGFKEKGAVEKEPSAIKDSEVMESSVIIIGSDNPLIGRIFGAPPPPPPLGPPGAEGIGGVGFSIVVKKNPWNPGKVIACVNAKSAEEVEAAFRKIFHYGKYSALAFDKGKNIEKKTDEAQRGIIMEKKAETPAVDTSAIRALPDVIRNASGKKIVYVGEFHDRFSHHDVQLQVIKGVYRKNKKTAIGMEMFERPAQKALDDYIGGAIGEREFLKKSEYFKRWGFDYNLYKPILDFARAERIPVVALNVRREIVEKVSKGGIDSLSEEEKKEIPADMDFSNAEYRERLRDVFGKHGGSMGKNFAFFFQSQILWDETMSQSIDDFFRKNPEYGKEGQMAVIAGSGHLAYGAGIPERTFRRNGYEYAIIVSDMEIEKNIANYIVFPKPVEGTKSPKLMAVLKEEGGKLAITEFPQGSVSEKAGLRAGDVLLSLDDAPVGTFEDVKIQLFCKKKGDTMKVKVVRKRFLLGEKTMEFTVTL